MVPLARLFRALFCVFCHDRNHVLKSQATLGSAACQEPGSASTRGLGAAAQPQHIRSWGPGELTAASLRVITMNNKQQQRVFLNLSLMEIPKQQPKHSDDPLVPKDLTHTSRVTPREAPRAGHTLALGGALTARSPPTLAFPRAARGRGQAGLLHPQGPCPRPGPLTHLPTGSLSCPSCLRPCSGCQGDTGLQLSEWNLPC